jgi:hypothetical protein
MLRNVFLFDIVFFVSALKGVAVRVRDSLTFGESDRLLVLGDTSRRLFFVDCDRGTAESCNILTWFIVLLGLSCLCDEGSEMLSKLCLA